MYIYQLINNGLLDTKLVYTKEQVDRAYQSMNDNEELKAKFLLGYGKCIMNDDEMIRQLHHEKLRTKEGELVTAFLLALPGNVSAKIVSYDKLFDEMIIETNLKDKSTYDIRAMVAELIADQYEILHKYGHDLYYKGIYFKSIPVCEDEQFSKIQL